MNKLKTRILLCEDDINLGSLLTQYLNVKGYETQLCGDGEKGYQEFMRNQYDICILDVMMPKMDGFTLATNIRAVNNEIPILFLTAKTMKEDVLEGFKVGADDYLTKPFNMEELLFRIEAILRRTQKGSGSPLQTTYDIGRYNFDTNKQVLAIGEKVIKLTTKESDLLRLLCVNMNRVLDRNYALKTIWLDDSYFNARSMDVYITKLRKHLAEDETIEILNVHGKGYKLIISGQQE
jgi:two-component system, OmpR family, response regulator